MRSVMTWIWFECVSQRSMCWKLSPSVILWERQSLSKVRPSSRYLGYWDVSPGLIWYRTLTEWVAIKQHHPHGWLLLYAATSFLSLTMLWTSQRGPCQMRVLQTDEAAWFCLEFQSLKLWAEKNCSFFLSIQLQVFCNSNREQTNTAEKPRLP